MTAAQGGAGPGGGREEGGDGGNPPWALGNCCRGDGGHSGGCQGDGGCLSDLSPLVLSPALLMHAAARHCGSAGGRAERTTVNEFRRNRGSPSALPLSFLCHSLSLPPPSPSLLLFSLSILLFPSFLMGVCLVRVCIKNVGLP